MQVNEKKAKGTSFLIAIRRLGGTEWKYLDGSGLRNRPELLYELLPDLERGIALPPSKFELLQGDS
jgi:hypothetical protein